MTKKTAPSGYGLGTSATGVADYNAIGRNSGFYRNESAGALNTFRAYDGELMLHMDYNGTTQAQLAINAWTQTFGYRSKLYPNAFSNWKTVWDNNNFPIEEGTWKPIIRGTEVAGSNTYAYNNGTYTRMGKLVYVTFELKLLTKDPAMYYYVVIAGLPFVAKHRCGLNVSYFNNVLNAESLRITANATTNQLGIHVTNTTKDSLRNISMNDVVPDMVISGNGFYTIN